MARGMRDSNPCLLVWADRQHYTQLPNESNAMLPPTSAHPSALSYRRDGTHSRPPSRSAGRSYPPPPPQGGAPQRHHRCPSHLYGETQAPGCKTSTGTFSGGGLGYRNFLPFGAQGEFSEPIIKIRQIALNSNSPKWPFGMILIRRSRVERSKTGLLSERIVINRAAPVIAACR